MPLYERETTVRVPLEEVWEFHSRLSGLEALTPDWMGLRVERVIGPDGEPDPDRLEAGSEVDLSMRPFGVGPRQHWTSIITERERDEGMAYFRDEMVHGPFDRWVHTHAFYADGDETVLRDHVDYELPLSRRLGGIADATVPISQAGFEAMFRQRHRATKEHLE
ncbi:SRPBCC family protein [Halosolutus halophilus]|uniref:SRPBCC family protein n=1 Tax=Halosolutus halophilus TaxID=1552990 RepID=UPI0022350F88|nr:SRPBCC family protein [Halosolutus halophilus]